MVSHGTRLVGDPETYSLVQSSGADSSMPSSYCDVPASMPAIALFHRACVP